MASVRTLAAARAMEHVPASAGQETFNLPAPAANGPVGNVGTNAPGGARPAPADQHPKPAEHRHEGRSNDAAPARGPEKAAPGTGRGTETPPRSGGNAKSNKPGWAPKGPGPRTSPKVAPSRVTNLGATKEADKSLAGAKRGYPSGQPEPKPPYAGEPIGGANRWAAAAAKAMSRLAAARAA